MYSLAQKRMMAKVAGENEVVLTMEEVEFELAKARELDALIVKYMEYVPEDVLKKGEIEFMHEFGEQE